MEGDGCEGGGEEVGVVEGAEHERLQRRKGARADLGAPRERMDDGEAEAVRKRGDENGVARVLVEGGDGPHPAPRREELDASRRRGEQEGVADPQHRGGRVHERGRREQGLAGCTGTRVCVAHINGAHRATLRGRPHPVETNEGGRHDRDRRREHARVR